MVPAHEGAAAFKVFDNVEDLLSLRLPHHPSYVQQGGDVSLPVGKKDTERKENRRINGNRVCLVPSKAVMTLMSSHI